MTKPIDRDAIYRKRAFDADIIELSWSEAKSNLTHFV
jgi:hypothetical protein